MTAPDYTHAINQLRWLIKHDFEERRGEIVFHRTENSALACTISAHWWDLAARREDIARLRSYIAAVRVLEGGKRG